jgi:hypothetical protein
MEEEEYHDMELERYLEMGVITIEGMDESGEIIFAINESAKDLAPELWESHMRYVDESLLKLYESGYMQVEYDENLEATLHISPEGAELAKEMGLMQINFDEPPNN